MRNEIRSLFKVITANINYKINKIECEGTKESYELGYKMGLFDALRIIYEGYLKADEELNRKIEEANEKFFQSMVKKELNHD